MGMITLTVNGERKQLDASVTLLEFLKGLGIRGQFMAVAYNGEVLRREEHDSIILKDGDDLELVRPVGGGCFFRARLTLATFTLSVIVNTKFDSDGETSLNNR